MNKEVIGLALEMVGASQRRVTVTAISDSTAEAEVVSIFRPHSQVGTDPEILDVKIPADSWVERFIGFLLGNTPPDDDLIGNFLPFRQLKACLNRWDGPMEHGQE
ncbi:MAG: hypothetical protein NW202_15325 [Nitrospira sp.]|nr:hypothetical protein [Nitrospira sp.]